MSRPLHITEASQLPDKTKCDLIVKILSHEMKTGKTSGKTYFSCKLGDVNGPMTAYLSHFGNSLHEFQGRTVTISGVEKGSYNEKPQFMSGKFSKVMEWVGDFEAAQPIPTGSSPRTDTHSHVAPQSPHQGQGNPVPVHPATAGMAINRGVEIWIATEGGAGARWDKAAQDRVEEIALQLVAMSQRIEANVPF